MKSHTIYGLEGFPLVKSGDNIAEIIVETSGKNGLEIQNGDIIAVAHKVISKAEGRVVKLKDIIPSKKARSIAKRTRKNPRFVELVLRETRRVLKATSQILLVEDRRGLICINAGIDISNMQTAGELALLPENPDLSARKCQANIEKLTGKAVAVVICDTYSRPFRRGQVNFAIGVAGMRLFRDYRGKKDLFDHVLKVKNVAIVDEIAAAAELLMGQAKEATPVIVLRGLADSTSPCEDCNIGDLKISRRQDLFRGVL